MPLLCAPVRAPVLRKRDHRGIFVVFRDFVIWAGELPKLPAGGDGLGDGCVGRGGIGSFLMTGPSGPVLPRPTPSGTSPRCGSLCLIGSTSFCFPLLKLLSLYFPLCLLFHLLHLLHLLYLLYLLYLSHLVLLSLLQSYSNQNALPLHPFSVICHMLSSTVINLDAIRYNYIYLLQIS